MRPKQASNQPSEAILSQAAASNVVIYQRSEPEKPPESDSEPEIDPGTASDTEITTEPHKPPERTSPGWVFYRPGCIIWRPVAVFARDGGELTEARALRAYEKHQRTNEGTPMPGTQIVSSAITSKQQAPNGTELRSSSRMERVGYDQYQPMLIHRAKSIIYA